MKTIIPLLRKFRGKYKILLYSGDADEVLGFTQTMYGMKELGWDVLEEFAPWYLDGKMQGYREILDGLSFFSLHGSGHMAA